MRAVAANAMCNESVHRRDHYIQHGASCLLPQQLRQRAGTLDDAVALEQFLPGRLRHAEVLRDEIDELLVIE